MACSHLKPSDFFNFQRSRGYQLKQGVATISFSKFPFSCAALAHFSMIDSAIWFRLKVTACRRGET